MSKIKEMVDQLLVNVEWIKTTYGRRIDKLEDNQIWIARLIIGTIIVSILGVLWELKARR